MNNILTNPKIFIPIIIIAFLFVILLITRTFQGPQKETLNQPINTATLSPYNKSQIGDIVSPALTQKANYIGEKTLDDGSVEYSFKPISGGSNDLVIVKDGIVIFEKTTPINERLEYPSVEDYLNKLGTAEKIIQGSKDGNPFTVFHIFASKGVTLMSNPATKELYQIHTFLPTTFEEYMVKWGNQYIQEVTEGETHQDL